LKLLGLFADICGMMSRERVIRHLVLPMIAPIAIVGLYFTPKDVFGCANRGLMALAVVFLVLAAGIATACKGIAAKRRGQTEEANWWIFTSLILATPLVLLAGPLG